MISSLRRGCIQQMDPFRFSPHFEARFSTDELEAIFHTYEEHFLDLSPPLGEGKRILGWLLANDDIFH